MTGDLPDINVWLAMAVQEHPHHTWARNYWSSAVAQTPAMPGPKLWFCRTTMLGLVRLLCQPKVVGTGALELPAAWNLYLRFRAMAQIGLLADPAGCETQLAALLSSTQPPPRLWTDTYLAALSQSSGLRLVTFDKDFARFGLANCLILDRS
jgi:toxin-antitoxin system PIN domain toxin